MKNLTKSYSMLFFVLVFPLLTIGQTSFKSLNYLYSVSGNSILSGQHNDQKIYHGNETGASYWTNEVYKVTGTYPALYFYHRLT